MYRFSKMGSDEASDSIVGSQFDPFHRGFFDDPYRSYDKYRVHDPVHWSSVAGSPGSWYLFRYADVVEVLKDHRVGHEGRHLRPLDKPLPTAGLYQPLLDMLSKWMILRDPPHHTRLRRLINKAFSGAVVERMRRRIGEIADALLEEVATPLDFDLIKDFAFPLPVIVIAELLGIPPQDRALFARWSRALASAIDLIPPKSIDSVYKEASDAAQESVDYLRNLLLERRKRPRADLMSELIAVEEQGDTLGEDDLLANCALLLFAGHETTVNLIGNGSLALLRHPAELEKLKDTPGLVKSAVEELLRYDSPAQMATRRAYEDLTVGQRMIRAGEIVNAMLGSANRDAGQFSNPDRLDISRRDNQHVSFGVGIHFCLGAPLARLEGQVAISTLLHRTRSLEARTENPEWRENVALRGLIALPVSMELA